MRWRFAAAACALLPGMLCLAADLTVEKPSEPQAQTIDLKFVEVASPSYFTGVRLQNGSGEMAFPNTRSKLKFRYKDGKLWVDSNADGRIDDRDNSVVPGNNAKVLAKAIIGARQVDLPIFVNHVSNNGKADSYAMVGVGGAMEGEINGATLRLMFGEFSSSRTPNFRSAQFIPEGTKPSAVPAEQFSKTLALGERLYFVDVGMSGWRVTLTPYAGPIAKVTLKLSEPTNACDLTLTNADDAKSTRTITAGKQALLVPGRYRISGVHLAINNDKGGHQCVSARSDDKATPLTLAQGQTTIPLGGPFKLDFTATLNGRTIEITDASASGVSGEKYGPSASNGKDQLFAAFIVAGGREQELTKLSYG